MSAERSPGPWVKDGHITRMQDGTPLCVLMPSQRTAEEWDGNGLLIAAAPDLLSVAESAPILSMYHGPNGFELERFIADYNTWTHKRIEAVVKAEQGY